MKMQDIVNGLVAANIAYSPRDILKSLLQTQTKEQELLKNHLEQSKHDYRRQFAQQPGVAKKAEKPHDYSAHHSAGARRR